MQESIVFLLRVQCRRKESSRSLSHLLMSFLYLFKINDRRTRGPLYTARSTQKYTEYTTQIKQKKKHK